jgi:hypothetical protein
MGYTGLSRVHVDEGLFLTDLHLDKIYCNERIDTILSQMKRLQPTPTIFQDSSKFLNVLCHNIEGLKNNFHGLRNHHLTHKADVICLTETWLNEQSIDYEQFKIQGFNLFYKTRFESFELNHPFKSKKGGGVAMYVKENLSTRRIELSKRLNLEYLSIEIEKNDITFITCYRSPQQNKNEFLTNLIELLKEMNMEKKILLVGDFNEDSLYDGIRPIEFKIESLGFKNLFNGLPTTKNLTSLDCVYSNFSFDNDEHKDTIGTYYSYHDELILSVNVENKAHYIDKEVIFNVDNRMEIDCSSPCSILDLSKTEKTKKRKRISMTTNRKKKFQARYVSPPVINNKIENLKERQMRFLRNLNKENRTNDNEQSVHTFDPNEQLDRIGFKKIDMRGDGNCFFRAVSHQILGHPNNHMKLRSKAVSYLLSNRNDFEGFLNRDENPTMEHYLEQMSVNGNYVDSLAIIAAAKTINKNIIIHEKEKTPICIPGSDFIDDQIHLWFKNDPYTPHYDSVKCINGDPAFLSSDQLIFR